MGTLIEDAKTVADAVATALKSSGYNADFSLGSLREIDRFFDEHSRNGEAVEGGLLAEQLGKRMFALGSYVGEVIIRVKGGEWRADDNDLEGEFNMQVVLSNGHVIWPIQRVMKRFKNGAEDGIYGYGYMVGQ